MVPLPPSATVRLNATVSAPLNSSTVNSARSLRTARATASPAYTGSGFASTSRAVLWTAWLGDRAVAATRPLRAAAACSPGRRSARTRTRSPAASVNGRSAARWAQVVAASRTSAAAASRRPPPGAGRPADFEPPDAARATRGLRARSRTGASVNARAGHRADAERESAQASDARRHGGVQQVGYPGRPVWVAGRGERGAEGGVAAALAVVGHLAREGEETFELGRIVSTSRLAW